MAETFSNNGVGNLNAGIDNVVTSLVLQAGQGSKFPSSGNFRILIDSEQMIVGARSGDTLSSITRGTEGTSAASHSSGATVTHDVTAGSLGEFVQKNLVDAKGDLLAGTADNTLGRLAAGTDLFVLLADSSQTTGLNWGGAWTSYTPTWTAAGTAPSLGNGTLTGRFAQLGKTVTGRILLTAGSSTTFGTGAWSFTLPVTAAAAEAVGTGGIGTTMGVHTGISAWTGNTFLASTTAVQVYSTAQPSVAFTVAVPFAWANTDTCAVRFQYEAA